MMSKLWLVDTHCHLQEPEFESDREAVIERARKEQILIIDSAISPGMWLGCLQTAKSHSNVFASIGLDPVLYENTESALDFIRVHHPEIVAVGEVGEDHYRTTEHNQRKKQEEAFTRFIEIASELKMPIQVHSRSAGKQTLEILSSSNAELVHMHAFDGKANLAREASRDLGYYFSVPTSVVRSPQKRKLVKAVDYEHLLVETDSPVLGPELGLRNEPTNVRVAVREVASILGRDEEEVGFTILENTLRLYRAIRAE
jgi:TatD DNase family protein